MHSDTHRNPLKNKKSETIMCKQKLCGVSKKKYRNKIPRKTFSDKQTKQNEIKQNKNWVYKSIAGQEAWSGVATQWDSVGEK